MRKRRVLPAMLFLFAAPTAAQQAERGPPPGLAAKIEAARFLGILGRSGLRAFLSDAGGIGEIENRAASYRMTKQVEGARTAELQGRLEGMTAALQNPSIPDPVRRELEDGVRSAQESLRSIPRYQARFRGGVLQAGSIVPVASMGTRPVYLHVKGTGYWRRDPHDYLAVRTTNVEVSSLFAPTDGWVLGLGVRAGSTRAEVLPFDGLSQGWSLGPRLTVGHIAGSHWAWGIQAGHRWFDGDLDVVHGSAAGPIRVTRREKQARTFVRTALMGTYGGDISVEPTVGLDWMSTRYRPTTDNLGQTVSGPFGTRDGIALLHTSVTTAAVLGAAGEWRVSIASGIDHELVNDMGEYVSDRTGLVVSAGVRRSFGRTRRVVVSYTYHQGTSGLRSGSGLTLATNLDLEPRGLGPPR